jgi:hypothetical protein
VARELIAPKVPVELGRVWLCGWSAWLWLAPLNRALVVLLLLVPVEPPRPWLCDKIRCWCPGVVCECVSLPPVALGVPVVLAPRGYRPSSAVTRVHPLGMLAAVLGHARIRSAGMVSGSSTKVDT